MIAVQDLRAGTIFDLNGEVFQVLSYEHIKVGRGSANIKVKVRNVRSGATTEKSFINSAKVQDLRVDKKDLQYLYKDSDNVYFMDPNTFEQIEIPAKVVGSDFYYLREGENYNISFLGSEPLSINLPPKMEFRVSETGGGERGNSATNVFKEAVLENGFKTKVPLFIKEGDKIRIDTRTGTYSEKAT